jgi:hypothetical protein
MSSSWLLALVALWSSACAIDTFGLARVTRAQNDSARMVRVEAWGLHLVTNREDAGLTIGRSRREYVYAREDAATPGDWLPWACAPLAAATAGAMPTRTDTLLLADVTTIGLALDANANRLGLSLGMRRRTALRVARDVDLVLALKFDSKSGGTRCASIRRNP